MNILWFLKSPFFYLSLAVIVFAIGVSEGIEQASIYGIEKEQGLTVNLSVKHIKAISNLDESGVK